MAREWVYMLIISTLLQTAYSIEHIQSCTEDGHSNSRSDFGEAAKGNIISDISHYNDRSLEAENTCNRNTNFEKGESDDSWNRAFAFHLVQSKVATIFFLCIFIYGLYRILKSVTTTTISTALEVEDNYFKEGALYGSKLILPGDWIRPLDRTEISFGDGLIRHPVSAHQAIWLRSKKTIDESIMKYALVVLTRQMPFLQQCVKFRYFRMWFKRINEMRIDFSTTTTEDVLTEIVKNARNFNPNASIGPLWRVNMLVCPQRSHQPKDRNFKSVLIFSVAHCITDAFTNNAICRETVRIYNQLIRKQPLPPTPMIFSAPLGDKYASYNIFEAASAIAKLMSPQLANAYHVPCIYPENIAEGAMKIAFELDELTEDETAQLFQVCKQENITINSYVTAAAAVAFGETVDTFSPLTLNQMNVSIFHTVDVRRYVKVDKDMLNGCYISSALTSSNIDLKNKDQFWHVANSLQEELKSHLDSDRVMRLSSIFKYIWLAPIALNITKYFTPNSKENVLAHIMSTNMGDISAQLPPASDDECAEIYNIYRTGTGANIPFPIILTFHTFRKVLKISVDINTKSISEPSARYFFSRLMNNVRLKSKPKLSEANNKS